MTIPPFRRCGKKGFQRNAMTETELLFLNQLNELIQNFSLNDLQMHQLRIFYQNLLKWNEVMNLTAITEEEDVYVKHFLDSFSLLTSVPRGTLQEGTRLIDVGTGAGFPGIPLAVGLPEIKVTLMDSLNKRVTFLEDTVSRMNLHNVVCVHGRAEDLGRLPDYREQYDIAVSRAVASLPVLNEYCLPFVRTGGLFAAYKSDKVADELQQGDQAARILGAKNHESHTFSLPGTDYNRIIILFRKLNKTPSAYPRKAGTPSRKPLV